MKNSARRTGFTLRIEPGTSLIRTTGKRGMARFVSHIHTMDIFCMYLAVRNLKRAFWTFLAEIMNGDYQRQKGHS
jgi:hypothetical protein